MLTLLIAAATVAAAEAGSIRVTLQCDEPVESVAAVQRLFTDAGVKSKTYPGRVENGKLVIDGLPDTGPFDLHIKTKSGEIEGWDAQVPPSDYVTEHPLTTDAKHAIFDKIAGYYARGYPDEVSVLDIQGNIEHAAILLAELRRRPSVGGAFKPGEMVWRIDRFEYENPQENTWTPALKVPYYALERRRVFKPELDKIAVVYSRALGGIRLDKDHADRDLGIIKVPVPKPGVVAVNPDGSPVKSIPVKPKPKHWPEGDS